METGLTNNLLEALSEDVRDNLRQKYVANLMYIQTNVCRDITNGAKAEEFVDVCNYIFGKEAMLEDNPYATFLTSK